MMEHVYDQMIVILNIPVETKVDIHLIYLWIIKVATSVQINIDKYYDVLVVNY